MKIAFSDTRYAVTFNSSLHRLQLQVEVETSVLLMSSSQQPLVAVMLCSICSKSVMHCFHTTDNYMTRLADRLEVEACVNIRKEELQFTVKLAQ